MAIRPRAHQLEEESITRFRELLPSAWVYRPKSPDYGIDAEVEIFDDEKSTGLSFLVQLKATDNPDLSDRVRLEAKALDYYLRFDQPAGVARYCSVTKGFYWQWASVIAGRVSRSDDQITVSYIFGEHERWNDGTAERIRRMLGARRTLATYPAGAPMPLRIDLTGIPPSQRYALERAMAKAIAESHGTLQRADRTPHPVEVTVVPTPNHLTVKIDDVASMTFDLIEPDPEVYVTSTLYALARLLLVKKLPRQAESVARLLLSRGLPHHDGRLAFAACQALTADLDALIELAVINGLHDPTNILNSAIIHELRQAPQPVATRNAAADKLFSASLETVRDTEPERLSAVYYSHANFCRANGASLAAIRDYNWARKLRPAYLQADYYLREVAGVLFEAHRYTAAVRAYAAAREINDNPELTFLHADALLLAGSIAEAKSAFSLAAAHLSAGPMLLEAELKLFSCAWLVRMGVNRMPRRPSEADRTLDPQAQDTTEALQEALAKYDGLHPRVRFNLGIRCENSGDQLAGLHHFLLSAYVARWDVDAWTNAAICAVGLKESDLLVAILTTGISRLGADVYDRLRNDLQRQGAPDEMLIELDSVAMAILADAERPGDGSFTLRILAGDSYEAMTIGGHGEG